jgi:uncharacterized membrane protein (UPF0127 family)
VQWSFDGLPGELRAMKRVSALIRLIQRKAIFVASLVVIVLLLTATYSPTESAFGKKLSLIKVCKDRGHCVLAELAATPKTLTRGLMSREKLPEKRGMLFVFPRPDFWHFWMKNTMIPLDIIWIDTSRRIVSIAFDAQPCLTEPCIEYIPTDKALYVLEVASGVAKKWNLKSRDRLIFDVPKEIMKKTRQ